MNETNFNPSDDAKKHDKCLDISTSVFSSWLSRNSCSLDDVSSLFAKVYRSIYSQIKEIEKVHNSFAYGHDHQKNTVFDDYIICLEDNRKLKTLKRHLKAKYNMSTEEYKIKWGLPSDYPVVAPNYAEKRSEIAKIPRKKNKDNNS